MFPPNASGQLERYVGVTQMAHKLQIKKIEYRVSFHHPDCGRISLIKCRLVFSIPVSNFGVCVPAVLNQWTEF
jgi:hypothetical protein